jgi:DNA protecting protein DprA
MNEAATLLELLRLPGIGPVKLRQLVARLFALGIPVERIHELDDEQLSLDARLSPEQIAALCHPASDAREDLRICEGKGIRALLASEPEFPLRLITVLGRATPPLLLASGNLELLRYPSLGISGSRKASEESLRRTDKLSRMVAQAGWVVVSGGARGTDEAAHLGCQKDGPGTIIVMPTGLLKPNLRSEFRKHLEDGKTLLLSEFPPEFSWTPGCAMQRNRILTALSHIMVLVEPGLKGGTGGTGRIALRLGTPLFILKTPETGSDGSAELLAAGAQSLDLDVLAQDELMQLFTQTTSAADNVISSGPAQATLFSA